MRNNNLLRLATSLLLPVGLATSACLAQAAPPATPSPNRVQVARAPSSDASSKPQSLHQPAGADAESPLVQVMDVKISADDDLAAIRAAYEAYFAQNKVDPQAVRRNVRRHLRHLAQKQDAHRSDQVLGLLQAALRHGQAQSWMYEAMGLTLQLKGMPQAEIERALMSAADFTHDSASLLGLADYLRRMGFEKRALGLYRQIGERHPQQVEAFEKALELARSLKDQEATQWAAIEIVRRAWPRKKMHLLDQARWRAEASIAELRDAGADSEADAYETKLKEALRRDLKVVIRWDGDADVDMMVEEPDGSYCSYKHPQTAAGGVLIGDMNSQLDRSAGEGSSEAYACSEAFDGTYRVLLRLVWGKITSGKVTVDVYQNQGTPEEKRFRRQITLVASKPSLVSLDLQNGRREKSIEEQQLENDVNSQLAINQFAANRVALAQQINAVQTPSSLASDSRQVNINRALSDPSNPLFGRRSAVGFKPEVSLLPEGTTLSTNAVISADRRYVRITALPFFSAVGDVSEFVVGDASNDTRVDDPDGG